MNFSRDKHDDGEAIVSDLNVLKSKQRLNMKWIENLENEICGERRETSK